MSNALDVSRPADRFVSIPEFVRRSSLCRATVYNMIDRGELPKPVRLTRNRVALPGAAVDAWFSSKLAEAA